MFVAKGSLLQHAYVQDHFGVASRLLLEQDTTFLPKVLSGVSHSQLFDPKDSLAQVEHYSSANS